MKRNWDLIKVILQEVESETLVSYVVGRGFVPHFTENDVLGHIEILTDAGILRGAVIKRNMQGAISQYSLDTTYLTMAGHDLLDCLRDNSTWSRICDKAKKAGITITWEFLKQAIPVVLKELI